MSESEYTPSQLLDDSRERMVKAIERELDAIRKAAETNDNLFQHQTVLYNFKKKLEE